MVSELFSFNPLLAHQHQHYWIRLSLIPRLGKSRLSLLATHYDQDIESFFRMSVKDLKQLGFDEEQICSITKSPEKELKNIEKWLEKSDSNYILSYNNPDYPELLKEVSSPPLIVYGTGDRTLLSNQQIAIVGSRNPTESGKQNAAGFARGLADRGCTVTSGLAMGIDSFAHKGAMNCFGKTLAVLGCGIDVCYPKRNTRLYQDIIDSGGCIVSEFVPGTKPLASHFPRRNRIISGLSIGTLVIEAAIKSGSLITAYYALQQNREVFAIPGNINNPLAKGCHHLIKQGAKLVEQVADILEEFTFAIKEELEEDEKKLQKSMNQRLATDVLLDSVDFDTTSVDMVAQRSGLPVSVVLTKLLEYELRGVVTSVPGGYIKLGD